MTVLRSREVPYPTPTSKSLNIPTNSNCFHPSTPSQLQETHSRRSSPLISSHSPSPLPVSVTDSTGLTSDCVSVPGVIRRRSSRLAAKENCGVHSSTDCVLDSRIKGDAFSGENGSGSTEMEADNEGWDEKLGVRSLYGGVEDLKVNEGTEGLNERRQNIKLGFAGSKSGEAKGKRKLIPDINLPSCESIVINPESKDEDCLGLRSGKRVPKMVKQVSNVDVHKNGDGCVHEERQNLEDNEKDVGAGDGKGEVVMKVQMENCPRFVVNEWSNRKSRFSRSEKGKWVVDNLNSGENDAVVLHSEPKFDTLSDNIVDRSRYAKEENGDGKLIQALLFLSDKVKGESKMRGEGSSSAVEITGTAHLTDGGFENDDRQGMESSSDSSEVEEKSSDDQRRRSFREKFRDEAIWSAKRLARLSDADEQNDSSAESEGEREIEDWPGPFSTAMKIARDRTKKDPRVTKLSSQKNTSEPVLWIPRKGKRHDNTKSLPPLLKNLCLEILAKNADAIASLDCVPDVFRHRLSRLLCDSRKMNCHFLDLLLRGSPTEVCIGDCSWLNEDEFVKYFQGCDTSKLVILQLDQGGRCIVDYALLSSLARSPNSLHALKSLSLSGACRLSDVGITALVSSAPALQSLNLCHCSFLTSSSIDTIANSLGSTLRELNLSHCQNLDPMRVLSALKKLEHLEVLSLAGIQSVCDDFIQEFVTARGHQMKELILTDCVKLTDKSIEAISETCSALLAIDLVNLSKLRDYALCCLASGCQALQKLNLSRNLFSDVAVAAFVEISGKSLRELSLNSVWKVGRSTAISLAHFSTNLVSLDFSWCRNITDEMLGLIVDNCSSLRVLKLFGCTQVTNIFLEGHSNSEVDIVGLKLSPLWEYAEPPDPHQGPSCYSCVPSAC